MQMSVAAKLLLQYYAAVIPLKQYMSSILLPICDPDANIFTPACDDDSPEYHDLVNSTVVALFSEATPRPTSTPNAPMMHMYQLIDRAQATLFSRHKNSKNILTLGYRSASENNEAAGKSDRIGIVNTDVNTLVTALQSPAWELLFQRIGIDAMLHLLTETSIFVSLPNGCLCQLTGDSAAYLPRHIGGITSAVFAGKKANKRKGTFSGQSERPIKRIKVESSTLTSAGSNSKTAVVLKIYTPAGISFQRRRIFYGRAQRVPDSNQIVVGLPPTHILNCIYPAFQRRDPLPNETSSEPDKRKTEADVRLLSKYVFPRQFSLSSPFKSKNPAHTSFQDRQEEIQQAGLCKTPKRLRDVLPMLDRLLWRHRKCGYKPLFDLACPSKLKRNEDITKDSSIILEIMSETTSQPLLTQMSLANISVDDSVNRSVARKGLSQSMKCGKNPPRFFEFACSDYEVYRYITLVTKAVIPNAFWGCENNFRLILRHLKELVRCRRFETLSLHNILQHFNMSECSWLAPPGNKARKAHRVDVSDNLKRLELLQDFMYWFFDSFVLPLLKTNFYVTESSAFKHKVLYFRQDDWEVLCAPLVTRLTDTTFKKMTERETEEILHQRKLGFSFVRLLPKETGVRPIVNLRQKKTTGPNAKKSINEILQGAFQILNYEKVRQSERMGAAVSSADEIYSRLKNFRASLPKDSRGRLPQLYFAKVDVKACFDTIDQGKLLQILRELISEDKYFIQRYTQFSSVRGKPTRKYVRKAVPEDEQPSFLAYANELAASLRHVVFSDQVVYQAYQRGAILQLLEEHITENIVKIGQTYYRQAIGIPQGSVLSAILCSYCYGDMEQRYLNVSRDPQCALFRFVDDYLLIATSLSKARGFLDMMNKGFPEYGCTISQEKTLTNFDYNEEVMNVLGPGHTSMPWCGYLINMQCLSVTVDYTRYSMTIPSNALTVERCLRPGRAFVSKMLQHAVMRAHIIYNDSHLNGDNGAYTNIYQNFLICAVKMRGYLQTWKTDVRKPQCASFIYDTIYQMAYYVYASIRSRSTSRTARASMARLRLEKSSVIWLGMHAFHRVLGLKRDKYKLVVKRLELEMGKGRHKRSMSRFQGLLRESVHANGMSGVMEMI